MYRLWTDGSIEPLPYWIERAEWFNDHFEEDAIFAGGNAYCQPLFFHDALYYWFGGLYSTPTFKRLRPEFQPYTFEDLKKADPDIFHQSFFRAWEIPKSGEVLDWLETNYEATPYDRYWVKKKPEE